MTDFHFVKVIRSWGNSFCIIVPKDFKPHFKRGDFVKVVKIDDSDYFIGKIKRASVSQNYILVPPDFRDIFNLGDVVKVFNIKQPEVAVSH